MRWDHLHPQLVGERRAPAAQPRESHLTQRELLWASRRPSAAGAAGTVQLERGRPSPRAASEMMPSGSDARASLGRPASAACVRESHVSRHAERVSNLLEFEAFEELLGLRAAGRK